MPKFPESDYLTVMQDGVTSWSQYQQHLASQDLAFAPAASVAWDSSPRTLIMDPYENAGYPWGPAVHSGEQNRKKEEQREREREREGSQALEDAKTIRTH